MKKILPLSDVGCKLKNKINMLINVFILLKTLNYLYNCYNTHNYSAFYAMI